MDVRTLLLGAAVYLYKLRLLIYTVQSYTGTTIISENHIITLYSIAGFVLLKCLKTNSYGLVWKLQALQ